MRDVEQFESLEHSFLVNGQWGGPVVGTTASWLLL